MANESLKQGQASSRNYGSMEGEGTIGFAGPSSSGFFDRTSFDRLCDSISTNIFQIAKHASNLEKTLKTIGTRNDTDALRDSVHTVATSAMKTINDTTSHIKQISIMVQTRGAVDNPANKEIKLRVSRLTSDFKQAVQKFTDTQKHIVTKMKITLPVNTAIVETEDQTQSLVDVEAAHQAQLQQHQQQLEFEQGLLLEREERVRKIETDILDVNDIMKELATLVVDQGVVVDSIEGNIDSTYTQVETGRAELQKAETYQSKFRKRLFCLLGVGVVILIIVVVVLVTQLKN